MLVVAHQSALGHARSGRRKATPPAPAAPLAARPPAEGSSVAWRLLVVLAIWWAGTPLLYALGWCLRFVTPGHRFAQSADQWFYANFLTFGAGLWIWCTIGFAGSAWGQ